jgi:DNA-binding NarL/FixJ family response regulator
LIGVNKKIFLADDHQIILDGLSSLLEKQTNLQVIGTATSGRETIEKVQKLKPDILILDITMPDINGIDIAKQIKKSMPEVRIVALSIHQNLRYVSEMIKAGASGYLLKQCAFEELALCLRMVEADQLFLSPTISQTLVQDYLYRMANESENAFSLLSGREREVLQLLAEGTSAKQIAELLNLSVKTVETHRQNVMRKIGAHNLADLVKYAIREGITSA